jgi:hypothetical protein
VQLANHWSRATSRLYENAMSGPLEKEKGVAMNRRNVLSALSLGSGALLSPPAIAAPGGSDRKSWQPDGLGYRARIGLLTPNDDAVPESEFWTMAPEGVSVHVSRVLLVDTRTFSDPPHPDDATALLAALPMQAIVFTFTTTGYVLRPGADCTISQLMNIFRPRDGAALTMC